MNFTAELFNYSTAYNCKLYYQEISSSQFMLVGIATFILSIVVHELGHWFALRKYRPLANIMFGVKGGDNKIFLGTGNEFDYIKLTKEQKLVVYISGFISGLIPIVVFAITFGDWVYLILAPYIYGSLKDIKLIYKCLI